MKNLHKFLVFFCIVLICVFEQVFSISYHDNVIIIKSKLIAELFILALDRKLNRTIIGNDFDCFATKIKIAAANNIHNNQMHSRISDIKLNYIEYFSIDLNSKSCRSMQKKKRTSIFSSLLFFKLKCDEGRFIYISFSFFFLRNITSMRNEGKCNHFIINWNAVYENQIEMD